MVHLSSKNTRRVPRTTAKCTSPLTPSTFVACEGQDEKRLIPQEAEAPLPPPAAKEEIHLRPKLQTGLQQRRHGCRGVAAGSAFHLRKTKQPSPPLLETPLTPRSPRRERRILTEGSRPFSGRTETSASRRRSEKRVRAHALTSGDKRDED